MCAACGRDLVKSLHHVRPSQQINPRFSMNATFKVPVVCLWDTSGEGHMFIRRWLNDGKIRRHLYIMASPKLNHL
jgi:hypothetical protein